MKKFINMSLMLSMVMFSISCSEDPEKAKETTINHVGEKWVISSVEYSIVDTQLSSPSTGVKSGTVSNAGAFYFDGSKGSFDMTIGDYHNEDVFGFTENSPDITLTSISQTVAGTSFSQYVIAISGEKTATAMTLQGTITKQSLSGQFVLTGTFQLVKE